MSNYLTFEQRILRNKRRKKAINFIILFLVFNYIVSSFIFKIVFFSSDDMFPGISKNSKLFFISKSFASFFYSMKTNEVVFYRNSYFNNGFFVKFIKEFFLLDKILASEYKVARIISTPGDIVYVKGKDVLIIKKNLDVYLNGIFKQNYSLKDFFNTEDVVKVYKLKENNYFLINDNLKVLNDSRTYGPVNKKEIKFILFFKI